jgi:hypothetical protein
VIPSLGFIVYSADRPTCETGRASDGSGMAWLKFAVPTECRRIVIESGAGYWVLNGNRGVSLGATDLAWCELVRRTLRGTYALVGVCESVAVTGR